MINIIIKRKADHIQEIELSGHAGYAEHGQDIVCAGVSSLAIHTVNALTEVAHIDIDISVDTIDGGYLKLTLPILDHYAQEKADLLLNSFALSIDQLQKEHSQNIHIQEI